MSSTSQDQSLEKAIVFILAHQNARSDWISIDTQGSTRVDDWSFITEQWWSLVADTNNRTLPPTRLHHRYLELCVEDRAGTEVHPTRARRVAKKREVQFGRPGSSTSWTMESM